MKHPDEIMKKALITGITGQDGSYLAEFLLEKGYDVFGMHRRSSVDGHHERVEHLKGKLNLVCGDLLDYYSLEKVVKEVNPDEIYNLAAQSQVRTSFDQPSTTREINWFGVERLLDVVKKYAPNARVYQASTSEMFGNIVESPQDEKTPFNPVSPYGESKLRAHEAVKRAREEGMFACAGILFNHESPRRGIEFITRKVTDGVARIKLGLPQRDTGHRYLEVGNLDAERDWGFAKDYVEAMWEILQQEKPKDYVIATGETHSVRELIEEAFSFAEIPLTWEGNGLNEIGKYNGETLVKINPNFFRPNELHRLKGNPSLAIKELGLKQKTTFKELVQLMTESDLEKIGNLRNENKIIKLKNKLS
jgi:GDPmannose 4,6-dehydratase